MNTVKIFIDRMRKSWYIKTTDLTDILTDSVWGLYDDPAVTAFMEVAEPYVKFQVYRKHDYILLTSESKNSPLVSSPSSFTANSTITTSGIFLPPSVTS